MRTVTFRRDYSVSDDEIFEYRASTTDSCILSDEMIAKMVATIKMAQEINEFASDEERFFAALTVIEEQGNQPG